MFIPVKNITNGHEDIQGHVLMVDRWVIENPLWVEMLRSGWWEAISKIWMVPEVVPTRSNEEVREIASDVTPSLESRRTRFRSDVQTKEFGPTWLKWAAFCSNVRLPHIHPQWCSSHHPLGSSRLHRFYAHRLDKGTRAVAQLHSPPRTHVWRGTRVRHNGCTSFPGGGRGVEKAQT